MILHEAIGVDLPIRLGASLAQSEKESLLIAVIAEDRLAAVAPVHHMIDCAGIFDAQRAGHEKISIGRPKLCLYYGLTPLYIRHPVPTQVPITQT